MATLATVLVVATGLYLSEPAGQAKESSVHPVKPAPSQTTAYQRTHHGTVLPPHKRQLEPVPAAPPTRLEIPSLGIDAAVGAVVMQNGDLTPPEATLQDLARTYWWVETAAPGYPTTDMTEIIGHSCNPTKDHPVCPSVFNHLQDIRKGALITVITPNGRLVYRVVRRASFRFGKQGNHPEIFDPRANTLVLGTCKLKRDHSPQTRNFALRAELVKATR